MAQMGQGAGQQAQKSQTAQSGLSGQGTQLTERDVLQLCLNETKHLASSLNIYIQEATSEQLRRDYMTTLGDIYNQEKQLYDAMQQKGYYTVKNANPQDITQASSKFSSMQSQ